MAESPNIDNLTIQAGVVSIKITGIDTDWRDMGEVSAFSYSQNVTTLEYKSKRSGIAKTVKKVVTELAASIKWVVNEITPPNLAIFAGGTVASSTAGDTDIGGLSDVNKEGFIRFVGDTDIGQSVTFEGAITITPNGDLNLLASDNAWMEIPLEAAVVKGDDGNFGVWTFSGAVT